MKPTDTLNPSSTDILARMIERLRQIEPSFTPERAASLESQLRSEFGGETLRIRKRDDAHCLVQKIMTRFNGRNAGQVAQELGIHRATVYRVLSSASAKNSP